MCYVSLQYGQCFWGNEPVWPAHSSTFTPSNHHQYGSNQLWCWEKMNLEEKSSHKHPTPLPLGVPLCFSPKAFMKSTELIVHKKANTLTCSCEATRQRQACQWSMDWLSKNTTKPSFSFFPLCRQNQSPELSFSWGSRHPTPIIYTLHFNVQKLTAF